MSDHVSTSHSVPDDEVPRGNFTVPPRYDLPLRDGSTVFHQKSVLASDTAWPTCVPIKITEYSKYSLLAHIWDTRYVR